MDLTWMEVSINVDAADLDDLSGKLIAAGVPGLVVEDEEEFHRFLEENRQYWDYVDEELLEKMKGVTRIKFYVTDDEDGKKALSRYLADISLPYSTASLKEQDWAHSWQKYYHPMKIGERLYIVPEWEKPSAVPEGRVPLYLNPGLTFGTGSHASTQLCLEGVEAYTPKGGEVLDLGCGSGILSIAALALGAHFATAVDIDPKAVGVAYENAALNSIGQDRYLVQSGDVLSDETLFAKLATKKYQLVLANIVADVIIPLCTPVTSLLKPDGIFICSGIIDSRSEEIAAALKENGYTIVEKKEKNGWVSFVARLA
jgi:ribosomal protein L11 methyltransferase